MFTAAGSNQKGSIWCKEADRGSTTGDDSWQILIDLKLYLIYHVKKWESKLYWMRTVVDELWRLNSHDLMLWFPRTRE